MDSPDSANPIESNAVASWRGFAAQDSSFEETLSMHWSAKCTTGASMRVGMRGHWHSESTLFDQLWVLSLPAPQEPAASENP